MMKTWVTSDLHFGHANIMKFCPATRKYQSVAEMDEAMIRDWNALVAPEDLTYILGDFAFHKLEAALTIVRRLNGRKILIEGNHDEHLIKHEEFRAEFEEIYVYHEISFNKNHVCLFHYPIAEFNRQHRGAVHFHGHLHGSPSGLESYRVLDVGMDAMGEIVKPLDWLVAKALCGQVKGHH
jgi:calcineurin-like phosphoesterase family protein